MSRSRKKTPIGGIACADSDRYSKTIAHRRYRRRADETIRNGGDLPDMRDTPDPWSSDKDGKSYFGGTGKIAPMGGGVREWTTESLKAAMRK